MTHHPESAARRLTPEQLARFRADYHECEATIVPLLDHVDVVTAERDLALSAARGEQKVADAAIERCKRLEEKVEWLEGRLSDNSHLARHYELESACERLTKEGRDERERLGTLLEVARAAERQTARQWAEAEGKRFGLITEVARLRALLLAVCGQHPNAVLTDGDTTMTLWHLARRLEEEGGG